MMITIRKNTHPPGKRRLNDSPPNALPAKRPDNLKDYFRQVARRTISKDRTITLNGRLYEGPVAFIGKRVELFYHDTEPEKVEVKYQNKSFGLIRPVDLHVNCRVKRDKNNKPQLDRGPSRHLPERNAV